ncbi:hypothetical protein WICMUC_003346 [Wickerhamomyces mucosus]|uniref:Pre-rRNA-processing protein RIX1 N-terminal domain-containing protein n=1 Tax=Wickerhamomyces mucosus TaxID=1378264 RepID=A0A9P8PLR9_9ASCO|nr:hypothetical protein WICMUC_003346 [Wickerhamomyces mucosus]
MSELSISIILDILNQPNPNNLKIILKTFHSSSNLLNRLNKSELNHLISKINQLLTSSNEFNVWYGLHLVQIISFNPIILSNSGNLFLINTIKLINHKSQLILKNTCLTISNIIQNIRGKPSLTREILTPNLSNLIALLIENLNRDIESILPILIDLQLKNITTFKPFLNKLELKLLNFLQNDQFDEIFTSNLQKLICKSYAYLYLNNTGNNNRSTNIQSLPDDQWRLKIFHIIDEIKDVLMIYNNLIELNQDSNLMDQLNSINNIVDKNSYKKIFDSIKIDLNSSYLTILQISKRLGILLKILENFIISSTPFALRIPLGLIIKLLTIIISISNRYIPIKREFNSNSELIKIISIDLNKSQIHSIKLIKNLIICYKFNILSSINLIWSSLEIFIPLKIVKNGDKNLFKIDQDACLTLEIELLTLLETSCEMLKLNSNLKDYEVINKLIDVSIILLSKRSSLDELIGKQQQSSGNNKQRKNKRKNKDSTPLSDILSHSELFEINPSKRTISTILKFFTIILSNLNKLSIDYRIKIIRYIISTSLKQYLNNGIISSNNIKFLENLIIYPNDLENYINLSIVKNILPNNEILSLLTNPRFPILDIKYRQKLNDTVNEEEDEEEEEKEVIEQEDNIQDLKPTLLDEINKRQELNVQESNKIDITFKSDEELKQINNSNNKSNILIFDQDKTSINIEEDKRSLDDEEITPSKRLKIDDDSNEIPITIKSSITQELKNNDQDEEDGSDFEIPDIDIGSDDDDE